jgi:hypothetical protein
MCKLVDGDDLSIVGEHHCMKHRTDDCLHNIHVVASEKDIVIELCINNFNVNEDGFSPKFYGDILTKPCGRGCSTVVSSKGDGRGYYIGGSNFLPYMFRHDACGCTFIDDTLINCGFPDLNWYLEGYLGGKTWFSTIKIKCDQLCVS